MPPLLKVQIWDKNRFTTSKFTGKNVVYKPGRHRFNPVFVLLGFKPKPNWLTSGLCSETDYARALRGTLAHLSS